MIVGFTGTRRGMTSYQKSTLWSLLRERHATELHHGDCVGADAQAHLIARALKLWIVTHPPTDNSQSAFCQADDSRSAAPFLMRNRAIVAECNLLIAAPATAGETIRSGTWATVRHAQRIGREYIVIPPSGDER